jgi:ABC-type transport system substrate-binding protein
MPTKTPGKLTNVLATGYELASDRSYYDVFLQKGVTFHDGTAFNAEAVKWNLDRVLAAGVSELTTVESIEAVDEYTVRLHLLEWNNQIIHDLWHDPCIIISPTSFEEHGGSEWANNHPIGTGPFISVESKSSPTLSVFDKNPNYWQEGLPYLDGVENHMITDSAAVEAALLSGEIHGTWSAHKSVQLAMKGNSDFRSWIEDGEFIRCLYMNTTDPGSPWYDERMRQALEYAIDKDTVIEHVGIPYSVAGYNIIKGLESVSGSYITPRTYDPDKARELMAAAGYADGVEFKIFCSSSNWQNASGDVLTAWQQQWAEVGFKAELVQIDAAQEGVYSASPMDGTNMLYFSIRGNAANPLAVVVENLAPGCRYFTGTKKPDGWVDLMNQALVTEDTEELMEILIEMDKLAYDTAMLVPLDTGTMVSLFSNCVHDILVQREGYTLSNTWIDSN